MKDYRKLRVREVGMSLMLLPLLRGIRLMRIGRYTVTHFDDFIDELLTQDRVCDIILPRLTQRAVLEETEGLAPRKSLLVRCVESST